MEPQWTTEEQESLLQLCQDLVSCVNKIMDPFCPQADRTVCNQKIEEFKDQSPFCLRCGFILAEEQNPLIRHFGLQLIEHFVKYRWETLGVTGGRQFQLNLLQYLSNKLLPNEQEALYVMEALAKVTVETAKRMWPQLWESFFIDMNNLSTCGPTHVELVLLIFRRLAEDIHLFESGVTTRRKREMAAALSEQAKTVFAFLIANLESPLSDQLRVVALSTIASFVEWIDFGTILMDDAKLIKLLYTFIGVEELKTVACECLLLIVCRKGDIRKTEGDRTKILSLLLSSEALNGILSASVATVDDDHYVFLKRACQVLVHLGTSQLAPLWLNSPSFKAPDTLGLYLQALAAFTKHDSQLLSLTCADAWLCFLSHNQIREDKTFNDFFPQLLIITREKLFKLGDPTQTDHVSSEYSRLDFDGIDEFTLFFSAFRSKMVKVVSQLVGLIPHVATTEALLVTEQLIQKKVESGKG